jgi:hypothetical protein
MRLCALLRRLFFAEPGSYKRTAKSSVGCAGGRAIDQQQRSQQQRKWVEFHEV